MKRRLPEDAFEFYFSLGVERSYSGVAKHYGVAKATVARHAKAGGWQDRVQQLERRARERFDKKAVDEMDAMRERHLAAARMLQAKALEALKVLPAEKAVRAAAALNIAWKHELLILGEPTERQASVEEVIRRQHARWIVPEGDGDGWEDGEKEDR